MRRSAFLLSILLVCLWPSSASADFINSAHAEIDWAGLAFTISGDITVTSVHYFWQFSLSHAESYGLDGSAPDKATDSKEIIGVFNDPDWAYTSARTQFTSSNGSSTATASASNGFIQGTSQAVSDKQSPAKYSNTRTTTGFQLWVEGAGVGTISVAVPYMVSVTCSSGPYVRSRSSAGVVMRASRGTSGGRGLHCNGDRNATWDGILTASTTIRPGSSNGGNINHVAFSAEVETSVFAAVPEPATAILMVVGLACLGVPIIGRKRN